MQVRNLAVHHVARPRLVSRIAASTVTVVEAGGGYGKTSLTMEIADAWPSVLVVALPRGAGVEELLGAVARAARTSRGHASRDLGPDAASGARLTELLEVFATERDGLSLVVDDVEHASDEVARLLVDLARALAPPHRLVLVGRMLPAGADGLDRLPSLLRLTTEDLALTLQEAEALAHEGFGLSVGGEVVTHVHRATGGWAAALVMSWSRSALETDDQPFEGVAPDDVLAALVERVAGSLDAAERVAAAQLAHLPRFDVVIAEVIGGAEVVRRLAAAGIAMTTVGPDWQRVAGPIAERLVEWAALDEEVARRAAERYTSRGGRVDAIRLLVVAGLADDAIALLEWGADRGELDPRDVLECVAAFDAGGAEERPGLLLREARALHELGWWQRRRDAVLRLSEVIDLDRHRALVPAVDAEVALDLVMLESRASSARTLAEQAMEPDVQLDVVTRLRALEALGRSLAFDPDPAAVTRARTVLQRAIELSEDIGPPRWRVRLTIAYAKAILFPAGRAAELLAAYDDVLPLTTPGTRLRADLQIYRCEALADLGRDGELEAAAAEAAAIAERLGDARLRALAAWTRALSACQRGEVERTLELLTEVELLMPDGLDRKIGIFFYADAAEQCLKIDRPLVARRYLRRLDRFEGVDGEGAMYVLQARAFLEALHGDPAEAIAMIGRLQHEHPVARDDWRRHLHRAAAYERAGDPRAASEAATAFEEAIALGDPSLPERREPVLARRFAALAASVGSVTASPGSGGRSPVRVEVLGGFHVEVDGEDHTPVQGRSAGLFQSLVVFGGSAPVGAIVAELWPDDPPERGRRLLRNALYRLPGRDRLVERRGDRLVLRDEVRVDLTDLQAAMRSARQQLAADPAAGIRAVARAMDGYTGLLLPGAELAVVAQARRELMHAVGSLADDAADVAVELGRGAEAIALLRRASAIDHAPARRVRIGWLLLDAGRHLDARVLADQIEDEASRLQLPVGREAQRLIAAVEAATTDHRPA